MSGRPKLLLVAVAMVAVTLVTMWATTGPTHGDTGDNLRQFDADVPECSSGVGTGIAFDGTQLLLSCWHSNVLERVDPADGSSNGPITISGMSDIEATAWDASRSQLWACEGGYDVYLIDITTLTGTFQFKTKGCIDGLAYDGTDDTIWVSSDVSTRLEHYATDGTLIESLDMGGKIGSCGNSGIAVGGDNLYLANDGCSEIYQCTKDLSTCTKMSEFPRRLEDLECDNITFAPKGAIWSQDAYDRTINAWEIPAGLCGFGGAPVQPSITLDPPTDAKTVGQDHSVTATVTDSVGHPLAEESVTFEVTDGPNAGDTATLTTDENGEATFTYTGDGGPGTDTIQACIADTEFCASASVDWSAPEPTPTPTPTPTATPTPIPTPTPTPAVRGVTQLPPTGGEPPAGSAPALPWLALAGAAAGLAVGGLAIWARRRVG